MQAPTLQEVTIEYADSFDATLLPISQRYLRSPARATTPEFDPGWRLHFASRRRVNGFHDYDTAYEKDWANGSVISFLLRSSSDLFIDSSFLRLSITMSQHARNESSTVWTMTHTIMDWDMQLDEYDSVKYLLLCIINVVLTSLFTVHHPV